MKTDKKVRIFLQCIFRLQTKNIGTLFSSPLPRASEGIFPTDSPVPLQGAEIVLCHGAGMAHPLPLREDCQRKNSHCSGLWVTELQARSCFRCVRHTRQAWWFLGCAGHSQRAPPHPALRQVKPLNIVHWVNSDCLAGGFRSAGCTSAWAERPKVFTGAAMVRYLVYFLLY